MLVIGRKNGQQITCRDATTGETMVITHLGREPKSGCIPLNIRGSGDWQFDVCLYLALGGSYTVGFSRSANRITITNHGPRPRYHDLDAIGLEAPQQIRIGRGETLQGKEAMA